MRELTGLAGVTVKALRHYERLRLLAPTRTRSGHRLYSTGDLERLRQILTLKRAEDPLRRWHYLGRSLWREFTSDRVLTRKLHEGFRRAWMDRDNWPDTLKRRFADYRLNEVAAFIGRVSIVVMNRRGPSWFADRGESAPHVA